MEEKVKKGDTSAEKWLDAFNELGEKLRVKVN
jgi:hypothetical protein